MSLDIYLVNNCCEHCGRRDSVYCDDLNTTHNLGKMAYEANLYKYTWGAEDNNYTTDDVIEHLEKGLNDLKARPDYYKQWDAPNGWGKHHHLVKFIERYLQVCKDNPGCKIICSR